MDARRGRFVGESMSEVPQIVPYGYRFYATRAYGSVRGLVRGVREECLVSTVERDWCVDRAVWGACRVLQQLCQNGRSVGRCTVGRLMCWSDLRGV